MLHVFDELIDFRNMISFIFCCDRYIFELFLTSVFLKSISNEKRYLEVFPGLPNTVFISIFLRVLDKP